jgi:hypothetical protein
MSILLQGDTLAAAATGVDPAALWNTSMPILGAIAVFLIGWIVATLAANVVGRLLKRSRVDSYLTDKVSHAPQFSLWRIAKAVVFWLILLITVVMALNVLNLTTASAPLNNFLNQIFGYVPRLASAAVLAAVAWGLATIARMLIIQTADRWDLDSKLESTMGNDNNAEPSFEEDFGSSTRLPKVQQSLHPAQRQNHTLSHSFGNVAYGFIFLLFLPMILDALGLQNSLPPVQGLLNQFLAAVPSIFKAGVIAVVGWFIARIVRDVVTNLLRAVGADRLAALTPNSNLPSLSRMGGMVAFVLVLIPTAITALEALSLPAISAPATAMLGQVMTAVPLIATAVAILVGAYFVGRYVAELVTSLLDSVGFNGMFRLMGVEPPIAGGKNPAEIVGTISLVGVMLFAVVAATNILQITALTNIVMNLTYLLGRVLLGLVIFGIGLYFANLADHLVSSSGSAQSRFLGQVARVAILVFVAAMAFEQMGIGTGIVQLAVGLILGSLAVAMAIAFGLGGREFAAKRLERWSDNYEAMANRPARPPNNRMPDESPQRMR